MSKKKKGQTWDDICAKRKPIEGMNRWQDKVMRKRCHYYYKMAPDRKAMKSYYKKGGAVFASLDDWAVIALREMSCGLWAQGLCPPECLCFGA